MAGKQQGRRWGKQEHWDKWWGDEQAALLPVPASSTTYPHPLCLFPTTYPSTLCPTTCFATYPLVYLFPQLILVQGEPQSLSYPTLQGAAGLSSAQIPPSLPPISPDQDQVERRNQYVATASLQHRSGAAVGLSPCLHQLVVLESLHAGTQQEQQQQLADSSLWCLLPTSKRWGKAGSWAQAGSWAEEEPVLLLLSLAKPDSLHCC